jgi:hypothetical protein
MDIPNNANQLHTISPSVTPADHAILPADHGISVPPPSPNKSKMLPPLAPSTTYKENEQDEIKCGEHMMDLAKDGSQD